MKRTLMVVALGVMVATSALAQEGLDSYIELLRSDIKTQKKALLTEAVPMSDAEAQAFWPVYREYELALDKIADRRLKLIKDYAANFDNMTNEIAQGLMKESFQLDGDRLRLDEKYFKEFTKATSVITAARVMQVENQINLLIRLQIAANLPLVEKSMDME